jgi:hypothetical protein
MRKFYFLSGLHRSGNTLLSSILNQHPQIFSASISPVCEYMWAIDDLSFNFESAIMSDRYDRSQNVISNIIENYYYDVDEQIIILRDKNWSTPENIKLIQKYITPDPKIIFTTRPILDVLASLVLIQHDAIKVDMERNNWINKPYLSEYDNMCDFLMRPRGPLDICMLSYVSLMDPELKGFIHVVEYNDLVESPEKIMKKINEFLSLDDFEYDFNNIENSEKLDYSKLGFNKDLHKIGKNLKKSSTNPYDIFSDYVLTKYSNLKIFLN